MLKHEDIPQPQTPSPSAAQVRVTPEELAAAVTALQIRKEGQPGTIAIGDAVEELGLDVTSEEVLAEVQARRAKPKRRRDYRALACAFACVAMFGVADIVASQRYDAPQIATVSSVNAIQADTLDEIGDEQQTFVDMHGLQQLIDGEQPDQVQIYPTNTGIKWGIIKHNGKIYVQAYTLQVSEKTFMSKPSVFVNSEDHYGADGAGFNESGTLYPAERVTLPVKALHVDDTEQTAQHAQITASDFHPDNHLWDEFKDRFSQ